MHDQQCSVIISALVLVTSSLLASACVTRAGDEQVIARVGEVEFTLGDLKRRYAATAPVLVDAARERYEHDAKSFLLEHVVTDEVLYQEALRRGLTPSVGLDARVQLIAATRQALVDEAKTTFGSADVQESDMVKLTQGDRRYAYVPERVNVAAMIFTRRADAERAAREAKGPAGKSLEGFRNISVHYPRAERWDFDVSRANVGWPAGAIDQLFAASQGSVIGPIAAKDEPTDERYYVLKVIWHLPEKNSFVQLKPMLKMMASELQIQASVREAVRAHAEKATVITNSDLLARLELATQELAQP